MAMFDIAIVEDEELERRALRKILEANLDGARIVGEARNGTEAVELIETRHIDLMLVDIRIPRPNGIEIIQMVRERGLATKVIILTAYDHFDIMQSAIHLKADNFLLKPVRTSELLNAVNTCLADVAPSASRADSSIEARIAALVDANEYRECLTLIRRHVEALYAGSATTLRRDVKAFLGSLAGVARARGLELSPQITRKIEVLEAQNLDLHSHFQVQELVCQITDALFEVAEERGAHSADHIQDVLNYIERNLHKGVTLEDAADFARISPCYLSRLFRREMSTTFISYITAQRIERAKTLLRESDLPISNVSLDLSFNDANYFCKAFKKEVGVSPSEYRRSYQKHPT